jgi:hypothetical protein
MSDYWGVGISVGDEALGYSISCKQDSGVAAL